MEGRRIHTQSARNLLESFRLNRNAANTSFRRSRRQLLQFVLYLSTFLSASENNLYEMTETWSCKFDIGSAMKNNLIR